MVLKLRKLVDQRHKWRSRGLSDFIFHVEDRLAQISSQDQLCFFKGSKVRGQGLLGRRWYGWETALCVIGLAGSKHS